MEVELGWQKIRYVSGGGRAAQSHTYAHKRKSIYGLQLNSIGKTKYS